MAKFVAEDSLARSERWQINRYRSTTHPQDFLKLAIGCFGQGRGLKLAFHHSWYCKHFNSDTSDLEQPNSDISGSEQLKSDILRDQRSIGVGLKLKKLAKMAMDAGVSETEGEIPTRDVLYEQNPPTSQKVHWETTFRNDAC